MSFGISAQDVALVLGGLVGAGLSGYGAYKTGIATAMKTVNETCAKNIPKGTTAVARKKSCDGSYPIPDNKIGKIAMYAGFGFVLGVFLFIMLFVINSFGMGSGSMGYRPSMVQSQQQYYPQM